MRLSELGRIHSTDIDWKSEKIAVRMKAGELGRFLDLDEETGDAILEHLLSQRSRNGWLFESENGEPLRPHDIEAILNRLATRAGLGQIKRHALRRARASYWLEQMDAPTVQQRLGIEYPSSRRYRRYTHLAWFKQVLWSSAFSPPPEE